MKRNDIGIRKHGVESDADKADMEAKLAEREEKRNAEGGLRFFVSHLFLCLHTST